MLNKLLEILRKISEIIAQYDDYNLALSQIVEILAISLDVDVCSVYVYHEADNELVLMATQGLSKESVGQVKMNPGEGLTGYSFRHRKILNLTNPDRHPKFLFFKNTGEDKFKSFLSVPLSAGGKCVGVLNIQRVRAERFPSAIVDMAKSLSAQLANLILNARMLQDLARSASAKNKRNGNNHDKPNGSQVMLRGAAANMGVSRGVALVFESRDNFQSIAHATHESLDAELKLLNEAIELTKTKTVELEKRALTMISEADASIFNVHLLFLEDKSLIDEIRREIINNDHSLEYSVKLVFAEYQRRFKHLGDQTFRDKVMDLKDVMLRLLESARIIRDGTIETQRFADAKERFILVADELLPSDLIRLPMDSVSGIVCEKGGATAHVAILAKALEIPALMGVKGAIKKIKNNQDLILDCHAELLYVNPSKKVVSSLEKMIRDRKSEDDIEIVKEEPVTKDGTRVTLRGNISLVSEASLLSKYGAKGIGLYRTEFLFMIRDYPPAEEDQFKVFSRIMREAGGEDVTIRALDTGGDKPLPYLSFAKEDNPALGFRGVRLLLSQTELFKTHLKAILRAGAGGRLKLLFPMVSVISELAEIRNIISAVEKELHDSKIKHAENYKIGIMLEVPSVVFALDSFLEHVDFMSIGSNDLIQYTFAVDRGNENVLALSNPLNPALLGILHKITTGFERFPEKNLAICGEMAAFPPAIPLLVGAGLRELSMSPKYIPLITSVIRAFSIDECRKLFKKALDLPGHDETAKLMKSAFASKNLSFAGLLESAKSVS